MEGKLLVEMTNALTVGTAIGAAASMLITLGVWVGLARAHLRAVKVALDALGVSQSGTAKVLAEVVRVLQSLDTKHTPEKADGAGFGTEWMREPIAEIGRKQEAFAEFSREHRSENGRDHDAIMRTLQQMGKDAA